MKPIATDTASFPNLVTDGYVYVDKTAWIHRLVSNVDGSIFFLSRPRRFGKSLMLSTLEAVFRGRRDLFRGLAIDSLPFDWTPIPVVRLSMTGASAQDYPTFLSGLSNLAERAARSFGIPFDPDKAPWVNFKNFLEALPAQSPTGKIAVLIDEYDAPIAGLLDRPDELAKVRKGLHDFYLALKDHTDVFRLLMLTGVSKFAKLSVFSGLNNLTDLSMRPEYAGMFGYTEAELRGALRENVEAFAAKRGRTFDEAVGELLDWYDGYRFSPDSEIKVCNPVSCGRALAEKRIYNFWEATGNASIIIERLRRQDEIPADLNGLATRAERLDVCDAETLPLAPLLYQAGYLTIRSVGASGLLELGIPNREVDDSLHDGYVRSLLGDADLRWEQRLAELQEKTFAEGASELVATGIRAAFAQIPHDWRIGSEREAKRYFLLYMKLLGADIAGEIESARGRADAVLKARDGIWVFEFKYGRSAREALDQARTRDYAGPWLASGLPVHLVGVNYDPASRALDPPLVEEA